MAGGPLTPPVTSATQTRIEAYFFEGSPAIPGGINVAELLRLIVLDLAQVNAIGLAGDPVAHYARHIADTMWRYGGPATGGRQALQYDCRRIPGGVPAYGVTGSGGSFDLGFFLARKYPTCNCYDLAAIIQVCCQALGNRPDLAPLPGQPPEFPVSLVFTLALLENRCQRACLAPLFSFPEAYYSHLVYPHVLVLSATLWLHPLWTPFWLGELSRLQ